MEQERQSVQFTHPFDPYFYRSLNHLQGKNIAIQTVRNPIQGILKTITPDHVVLEVSGVSFYIRNQMIVWVTRAK